MTASTESSTQSHHDEKEAIAPARLVAYALGNFGQSAFYNALSTYFVVYVTSSLFSGVDKARGGQAHRRHHLASMVIIRIAEIFVDPLLGNLVDNTTHQAGAFPPMAAHRRSGVRRADRHGLHWPVRLGERQHHAVHRAVRGGVRGARRVLLPARYLLLGHDPRASLPTPISAASTPQPAPSPDRSGTTV